MVPERELRKGGRPKLLTEADRRYCVRLVTKRRIDNAVKVKKKQLERVRRVLRSKGLGAIEKPKKPALSKKNVKKRFQWYKKYRD